MSGIRFLNKTSCSYIYFHFKGRSRNQQIEVDRLFPSRHTQIGRFAWVFVERSLRGSGAENVLLPVYLLRSETVQGQQVHSSDSYYCTLRKKVSGHVSSHSACTMIVLANTKNKLNVSHHCCSLNTLPRARYCVCVRTHTHGPLCTLIICGKLCSFLPLLPVRY